MKGRIHKLINELLWATALALFLSAPLSLAISQAMNHSAAQTRSSKPLIVKKVTGTITAIDHPRAGTSVTITGTDGITYQYGVEEGKIVGATAATLKMGDRVSVEFYKLTENYPPTYGNPIQTVLLPPSPQPPLTPAVQNQLPPAQPVATEHVKPTQYYGGAAASFQNNQIGVNTFVSGPQGQIVLLLNSDLFRNSGPSGDEWNHIGTNVKAVALDPSNEKIIYALSAQNAIMKTLDQGEHWLTLDTGTPNQNLSIIFVNPASPQEVYAGGTAGLLRTEDAGFSWQHTGFVGPVSQIVIDPLAPNVLHVLSAGGIFASTDHGVNWTRSASGLPTELVKGAGRTATKTVAPVSLLTAVGREKPMLLAAAIGKGVYRSEDNGATWAASGNGLDSAEPILAASIGKQQITLESSNSLFRSSDGTNWSRMRIESGKNLPVTFNGVIQYTFKSGLLLNYRFPNDGEIENVGPQRRVGFLDARGVLVGLNYGVLHHSEVDGLWTAQQDGKPILFAATFNGEDLDQVERSHRPTFLYVSRDNGYSWDLIGNSQCGKLGNRPKGSLAELWLYGSASCVMRTRDAGLTWEQMPGFNFLYANASVSDLKFDPIRHEVVYYSTYGQLMRYQYNENTKQGQAIDLKAKTDRSVVDEANPTTIFTDEAQLSSDGGWTWTDKSKTLDAVCKCDINAWHFGLTSPLSFRAGDIRVMLAYGANAFNGYPGDIVVMQSRDSGASWSAISKLAITGLRAGPFVNPDDSQDIFIAIVSTQGTPGTFGSSYAPNALKILESADGGPTWNEIYRQSVKGQNAGQGFLQGVAKLKWDGGHSILLATSRGLLRSDDDGHTWNTLGGIR